jgi:hypothetical protein
MAGPSSTEAMLAAARLARFLDQRIDLPQGRLEL